MFGSNDVQKVALNGHLIFIAFACLYGCLESFEVTRALVKL